MIRALTLATLVATTACATDPVVDDDDTSDDGGDDATLDGNDPSDDTELPAALDQTAPDVELALATQVVYVNFGGPVIYACPTTAYCNDAVTRHHHYINQTWHKSSIDFASWGTSTQRATVIDFLRSKFSPYRVAFTTTKPTSGDYTMLVISSSKVGTDPYLRGKTDTDCYASTDGAGRFNVNHRDIAFVVQVGGVSSSWVKRYAAHELAHSFGLLHVTSTSDLMQYKSDGYSFLTGSYYDTVHNPVGYRCVAGSRQNEPALLAKGLGLK